MVAQKGSHKLEGEGHRMKSNKADKLGELLFHHVAVDGLELCAQVVFGRDRKFIICSCDVDNILIQCNT